MRRAVVPVAQLRAVTIAATLLLAAAPARAAREVAVTFDDLPLNSLTSTKGDAAVAVDATARLLAALRRARVPAVGFVNEQRLRKPGEVEPRTRCLRMWVDAGFELGNHTFSHLSLHTAGLKAFEHDIVHGEPVTRALLAEHQRKLRYFRHPFLETGNDAATKRRLDGFLAARGYTIAPVTVDSSDWMFAAVYNDAERRGDTTLQRRVVRAYLVYVDAAFTFAERLSENLLGRDIKQVLLLHANALNATYLPAVLQRIRARGYRFISLGYSLTDAAYASQDSYVGDGQTWLYHWAASRSWYLRPARPPLPTFIVARYRELLQSSN